MRTLLVALALLAGCTERGSITAPRFTAHALESGACVVVADLVSSRDSSNVDLTLRACAGDRCSAPSRELTEGPFQPERAKTVQLELGACPPSPDRVEVDVSRWGSTNNDLPQSALDGFEKAPADGGGCAVTARFHLIEPVADSLVFLVVRDAAGLPLERTLPFPVAQNPGTHRDTWTFAAACDPIAAVEAQVVN